MFRISRRVPPSELVLRTPIHSVQGKDAADRSEIATAPVRISPNFGETT
jgi:hypothetical protein